MISFRKHLRDRLVELLTTWVGPATALPHANLIDDHLYDVERTSLPFVVATVRRIEPAEAPEIGTGYTVDEWEAIIYYLDIQDRWADGDDIMNNIVSVIAKELQLDRRLGNLEVVDPAGNREYVFNTRINTVLFDTSGQEGEYSFVSEIHLTVQTDKS
jgi:hypothetical protein